MDVEESTAFTSLTNREVNYVNPAQYQRIVKRRNERAMREAVRPTLPRQKYLHESRHAHALNRVRGEKGRFVNFSTDDDASSEGSSPVASPQDMRTGPARRQHGFRASPLSNPPATRPATAPPMRRSSRSEENHEENVLSGASNAHSLHPHPTKEMLFHRRPGADSLGLAALTATPSTGSVMGMETGNLESLLGTPDVNLPLELFDELMF